MSKEIVKSCAFLHKSFNIYYVFQNYFKCSFYNRFLSQLNKIFVKIKFLIFIKIFNRIRFNRILI